MIGDDIEIVIVRLNGNSVRLGFKCPKSVSIYRKEIWKAIQREKEIKHGQEKNTGPD